MAGEYTLSLIMKAQDQASGVVSGFLSSLGPVGDAVAVAGAALIGVGVASVHMAGDFQQAMLSNVAHAGLAKNQIDSVSQSVMQMSTVVGRSPTELADALYPILSGFSGIQNQTAKSSIALLTLKDSFEAVAGTTVNGTSVANAAIGTFNALGLATNNVALNQQRMTSLFDVMDKTVQTGNMTWDAYKNVISKLAISIQGTGVSFNEASAALATMTNEGFSAQKAQTYLSNMFTTMAIKTDALATHAKKLGISFNEPAYSAMTLAQKISYLNDITDGNKQKILALLGGNATALKSFNALSIGLNSYKDNLTTLNHSQGALASSFQVASSGFNAGMSRMKAAGDVLMITIGQALLPVLTKVVNAVTPAILAFSNWAMQSGVLNVIAGVIGTTIDVLAGTIGNIVGVISSFVGWLNKASGPAQALRIALIAIGAAIAVMKIGNMIADIIDMIPAMIGWIAETWAQVAALVAEAIAEIAANWPIYVIIAVIALVVLAIMHWGAIVQFFSALWKTVWTAVSSFFVGVWNHIVSFISSVWATIVNFVKAHAMLLLAVITGPIGAIVILIVTHWSQIMDFLKAAWAKIVSLAGQLWGDIVGIFEAAWNGISGALSSLWNNIINWVTNLATRDKQAFQQMWADITGIFSNAWSGISNALSGLRSNITNWMHNLASNALQWGKDMIQNLINGITSMAGGVGNAVQGIASKIAGFLHFTKPDVGPLASVESWMPDFGDMLAKGMLANIGKLQAAANAMAKPLAISAPSASAPSSVTNSTISVAPPVSSGSSGGQTVNLTVNVGGKNIREFTQMIVDELSRLQRMSGLSPATASGRRY